MYLWKNNNSTSLLCAGTDMRIRNWNLTKPTESHFICRGPADTDTLTAVYQLKKIDGIEVTVEAYQERKHASSPPSVLPNSTTTTSSTTTEIKTTRSSTNIPPAHTDAVTGMQIVMAKEPHTPYLVTVSCDSVVKIWK